MRIALVLAAVLGAGAAFGQAKPHKDRLVLADFADLAKEPQLASSFGQLLGTELAHASSLEVISPRDVVALLGVERERQLLGCSESSCMAELGGMLAARYVVTGSLAKTGGIYIVS